MTHAAATPLATSPVLATPAYAVRAVMFDGASIDLLLFHRQQDAEDYAALLSQDCRALGYDRLTIVERLIIGKPVDPSGTGASAPTSA
jgi:hypothetical protein